MHPRVVMLLESSDAGDTRASSALKQAGYQVRMLTLEIDPATIARFKPQAVVFDVGRQSANAYEFLSELRKSRNLKDAVMIGVFGEKESNRSRRAEDFDHRLRKPVDLKALLSAIGAPPQAAYRALLVEDHGSLAEATAFLMRHEGLEVWIAATGRDALKIAARVHPEIVLCDLHLPDMSGLDVARKLRVGTDTRDALIAIHTAMSESSSDIYRQHTSEFVNLFVPKPLSPEKVGALISEVRAMGRMASRESRKKH
jgi:DNA-binding response OmpR family regulator